MQRKVAFDSKNFNRTTTKLVPDPNDSSKKISHTTGFFSPLACGVSIKYPDVFESLYKEEFERLRYSFGFQCDMPFLSSRGIREHLNGDMRRAIAFCDQLVKSIQDLIEHVFFSYIVLPPNTISSVTVGGENCPTEDVGTHNFLRSTSPAFSAIAASQYVYRHNINDSEILVDGFRYKKMSAWNQLLSKCNPQVYSHGDECNPFISVSDIIAFLTDQKLLILGGRDTTLRKLKPENIELAWEGYSFATDVRFLDEKSLGYYTWKSRELIDLSAHYKRPMVFFLVDRIDSEQLLAPPDDQLEGLNQMVPSSVSETFNKQLRRTPIFQLATKYAYLRGGCVQFFDPQTDARTIRDGDTLVYMGSHSKKTALTLSDGLDITVFRAKDLKDSIIKIEKERRD